MESLKDLVDRMGSNDFDEQTLKHETMTIDDADAIDKFVKTAKGNKLNIILSNRIDLRILRRIKGHQNSVKNISVSFPGAKFEWLSR